MRAKGNTRLRNRLNHPCLSVSKTGRRPKYKSEVNTTTPRKKRDVPVLVQYSKTTRCPALRQMDGPVLGVWRLD